MIQKIAASLSALLRVVLVVMLSCWAIPAQADTFAAVIDNERLSLTCDGPAMVDTACRIGMGSSGGMQPVRFTTQPTSYAHLLRQGIEKVLESKQHRLRPSASDIPLLRELALDQCHPAARSDGLSGDILQLCIPADSSNVILFMRGLCDRCDFEPVILKKQAPP